MHPKPQTRNGPTGKPLSLDFVLSDRYFVHTWKDYSAFGNTLNYSKQRLSIATRFLHEGQDMKSVREKLQTEASSEDKMINETGRILNLDKLSTRRKKTPFVHKQSGDKMEFVNAFQKEYDKTRTSSVRDYSISQKDVLNINAGSSLSKAKEDCLPCSRKRRKGLG